MSQDTQALLDRIPDAATHDLLSRIPGGPEPAGPPVQGAELPLPFEPLIQSQTGAQETAPAPTPSSGAGLPGALYSGLEDVVRGAELGLGSMAGTAGRALARARNALAPGDTTAAERQRRIGRAGGLGEALTAQGLTHPAPTTLPGQILQGAGNIAPILVGSAIDPMLGIAGMAGMAGAGVEDRYNQVLKETGSDVKATEAALAEIPLQGFYLAPVGRLLAGPGGTLARRAIDGAITGTIGPGAARVLGEAVHEQITKEDAADLGAALKRGLAKAGQEAKVNAPLFMFLSAAAHGTPEEPPPEAIADKLAGGQEETPLKGYPFVPPQLQLGAGPEIRDLPPGTVREFRRPPTAQPSGEPITLGRSGTPKGPEDLSASEVSLPVPQGPPPRIIPQTQPEPIAERPATARPSLQSAAQDPELLAVAQEYEKASERRKLDIREQLQDNLREFLTPEDIKTIAKGAAIVQPQPPAANIAQPELTNKPAPETKVSEQTAPSAEPAPVEAQPTVQLGQPANEPLAVKPEVEGETPQTVAPEEQPLTSTKNAVTEAERAARGEPPLEDALHKAWGESLDNARAAMAKDPGLIDRIIKGEQTPELTQDERQAALGTEKVTLYNERNRLAGAALENADSPEAFKAIEDQRKAISDRLLEVDAATKTSGAENARAQAIRRMMLAQDYSIAAVETEFRLAKGGADLTPEEYAKAEDLSRRLIAAEKQVEEIEGNLRVQREAKAAAIRPQPKIISFLDAQADQARARLAAKRGRAGGGLPLDPQDILDVARIAASHIAHGIDAGVQLIKDFGEEIRPHLEEILAKARQMHEDAKRQSGSEKAAITRATKTAAKLRAKTAAGDFEPEPKPEPLPMTPERLAAKTDLEAARKEYEAAKAAFRFKNRTLGQKALGAGREILNIPKQLLTGFDLSATLFQGGMLSASHPVISTKALGESVRALMSERKTLEIDTALRSRPNFAEGQKAGLELTQLDGPLSAHEEHMRSNWAGKIPFGIGKGIEASNRAFTTFLNVQRAMAYDKLSDALPQKSPKALNAIANFVNVATGRGYTPAKMRGAISAAANVLWSPRLLLSRFQLLAGQPLYRGNASTRTAIATEYAKSLMALGAIYAVSKLAGADVDTDPRGSDFGKIRIGNARIDPLIGLSQITTLMARVGLGQTKTSAGKIEPIRPPIFDEGKGPGYGQSNTADVLFRFLRTKFSPTIGVPLDLLAGKDVVGQPVTPASLATNTMVPMAFQDVYQAMRDRGMSEGAAIGLLSILGMHVQVYQEKPPPKIPVGGVTPSLRLR